ncbi:hypothetical protein [Klebsiella pneumoniae]|uniref:hypothetical protein n=1 Tax=Klebsiella pneumoniae TaxID=573 RepID=UPI0022F08092|nr:hypothetical protein [Klebsiella pneumoniae]MDA5064399.1 hypothetical protein [Klebsiella pneumoniae]
MLFGWLFESPDDGISGDNHINLEHLPPDGRQINPLIGVRLENGIYGHSRFCNTDFDDKLACLNLSGV